MPHDEQPLTRRALRELERQKPRKQQKEDAKAAEEASAERRAADADAASTAAAAPAPVESSAPVEPPASVEPEAPASATTAAPTTDSGVIAAVPFAPAGTPALSRRARRALSTDHPLAEQHAADQQAADEKIAAEQRAAEQRAAIERTNAGLPGAGTATGPIIAELIHDGPDAGDAAAQRADAGAETNTIEVVETGAVYTTPASTDENASAESTDDTSEVVVPVVEELIVVDGTVDPEVASQEDEEFAEIDDTVAPEAVHVITIDENPSGPILSPLFPAAAGTAPTDREVDRPKPTDSSFDALIASRGVGSSNSVATTSALVLPSVPNHGDVGTALDETGEVIITGSIDLPMSLGSMGAAPADGLESSELDAYLDPDGDVGSDVAPVSATRAVSTHGSSSGLIAPPKRSRTNAPVVLAVVAGVLAIGVIGLIVAVVAFRII
ncbi:hypothetical protein C5B96_06675 [Subtercola sp. Z020]|nr:hypothetical protein C5B96_06675 [Subtercola sp. Z020]